MCREQLRRSLVSAPMVGNLLLACAHEGARDKIFEPQAQRSWIAGQVVYDPAWDHDQVVFPYSGVAAMVTPVGASKILTGAIGADGAIGLLQGYRPAHLATKAVALTDMDAWATPRSTIEVLRKQDPTFDEAISRYIGFLRLEAEREIACRTCHGGRERIAGWLSHLFQTAQRNELRLNQQALADLFCVQRTTMNAFAKALRQAGALRYRRVAISLDDRTELDRRSCGCRREIVQARALMGLPTLSGERPEWSSERDLSPARDGV